MTFESLIDQTRGNIAKMQGPDEPDAMPSIIAAIESPEPDASIQQKVIEALKK